jgi:low affinity Fe/Cu permease
MDLASRLLRALDWLASASWIAVTVVFLDLLWVVFSARFEFPPRLESVFTTLVSAVTLAMVFVIQHTQSRQQAVTQRKLDEILRALPDTDRSMIALEGASAAELRRARRRHKQERRDADDPPRL